MSKKKEFTPKTILCQSVCILIFGAIAFTITMSASSWGFDFSIVGYGIIALCIIVVIGLIIGVCKPRAPSHWDDTWSSS